MKKLIRLLIGISTLAAAFAQAPAGPTAKAPKTSDSTMPESRVKETLEDARVKSFLKMVETTYGGTCARPTASVKAKVRSNGSGDFSSTFYDFEIPCSSKNKDGLGLKAIGINAEFSPPRPGPLNLILSVHLKE